jgi:RAD51-like protein 2
MVAISALDALKREDSRPFIPTFSKEIDKILDGGIPMGSVTEICGMAGLGKTQLW